jgi:peptidoglycan hydrolase-like protein with peptidoglycan-binding domain
LLKPGDKGTEVINLQRKLYEIGYNITVDGIYGNAVVNTLKTIQTENKLNASGNYTVETKNILDNIKNIRTYKKP